ncbi:hypothetical protein [Oceanobacillus sp. FSL H7-0719]|uniref:hypothetical protein n=1 Tax=Oceanobacillus sp. FSL H7-0719 TaxID=2954507 RepID=UPI003249FB2B
MGKKFILIPAIFLLITSLLQLFNYNIPEWVSNVNLFIIVLIIIVALKDFFKKGKEN